MLNLEHILFFVGTAAAVWMGGYTAGKAAAFVRGIINAV